MANNGWSPNLLVKTLAQIVKVNAQFLVSLVPFPSKNKGFLLILEGAFGPFNFPLSVDQIIGVECVLERVIARLFSQD